MRIEDPRAIPIHLQQLGIPRPAGISAPDRANLDDFYLVYQEERQNMPPFLVFTNLTGW